MPIVGSDIMPSIFVSFISSAVSMMMGTSDNSTDTPANFQPVHIRQHNIQENRSNPFFQDALFVGVRLFQCRRKAFVFQLHFETERCSLSTIVKIFAASLISSAPFLRLMIFPYHYSIKTAAWCKRPGDLTKI